jgi:hypothetical protein
VRVSARITGAALVVTAALTLTGCNGSTGSSHSGKHKSGSSSHAHGTTSGGTTSGGTTSGGSSSSINTGALKGVWQHGSGVGTPDYVLMDLLDHNGVVVTTLKASCVGSYESAGGALKIHTKCKKGHGFESGTIKSLKNGKLTVFWDGGTTDVFQHAHNM